VVLVVNVVVLGVVVRAVVAVTAVLAFEVAVVVTVGILILVLVTSVALWLEEGVTTASTTMVATDGVVGVGLVLLGLLLLLVVLGRLCLFEVDGTVGEELWVMVLPWRCMLAVATVIIPVVVVVVVFVVPLAPAPPPPPPGTDNDDFFFAFKYGFTITIFGGAGGRMLRLGFNDSGMLYLYHTLQLWLRVAPTLTSTSSLVACTTTHKDCQTRRYNKTIRSDKRGRAENSNSMLYCSRNINFTVGRVHEQVTHLAV
jgi:hypothetical protein